MDEKIKIVKDKEKIIGIIKEMDKAGRIVIPKKFRERLKLFDKVEIVLAEECLLIVKPKECEEQDTNA